VQTTMRWRLPAAWLFSLVFCWPLFAQRNQIDPLTPAQQEKIAEAGIDPDARISLYTTFLNDDADIIQRLVNRTERGRDRAIDAQLQKFAALTDELSSNLDEYGDRKADLRKSLKSLDEAVPRWQQLLKRLPNTNAFQVSRDTALDSLNDLAGQTKQLTADQSAYFKTHKKAKGQERAEPD
jgi:ABC-type transporter Mla subunit MlaD